MTIEQEYLEKYINPRIKILFEQANGQFYISPGNQTPRFMFEHNDMLDFVDLIVKEGYQVVTSIPTISTSLAGRNMLNHFGVEE